MNNGLTNKELDLSLAQIGNEKRRLNQEENISKNTFEKGTVRNLKVYKSRAHKRRKKLIKKVMIGTLIATISFGVGKKLYDIATDSGVVYYEVQDGDTLGGIASKFSVPIDEIRRDNGSKIGVGDLIRTGDVIAFVTSPKLAEEYEETHDMQENKEEWYGRSR